MSKTPIYRVVFHNQGKIYEVYARHVRQGALFGFVEIEKLIFGEKTSVVVDPAEENLKTEFEDVVRTQIPMHSVIRIDEVNKRGACKISTASDGNNVMPFPIYTQKDGNQT